MTEEQVGASPWMDFASRSNYHALSKRAGMDALGKWLLIGRGMNFLGLTKKLQFE